MKKFFVIIASALLFAGCNGNREVDIQYQLTANVDLTTIVKGMQGAANEDFYTKDSKDPVLLTFLLYDETGTKVYETNKKLANFFEKTSFTTDLKSGNYTVVAWACIASEGAKTDWEADKKESLNTLILKANYNPSWTPVLGVSKLKLDFNKTQTIDIAMPTVGCFFSILFSYSTATKAKYVKCQGLKDSDYYEVDSETSYLTTSTGTGYEWEVQYTVDTKYGGIYWCYFMLPNDFKFVWGSLDANNIVLNASQYSFKAEAGKHRKVSVNIDTGTSSITPASSPAIPGSADKLQILDVGKMKTEPAKISTKQIELVH